MDLHAQMLLEEYDELQPTLVKLEEVVKKILHDEFADQIFVVNSYQTRVKTRESLQGKLELKGQKYKTLLDLTDLVGGRIITFYIDGVDRVAAKISEIFDVDWANTVDKRNQFDIDRFGYASLHYICRLPESVYKSDKYPRINEIEFEIQMRTILQHAWASISHDTGYKNDVEVPKEILRTLNSLAGLLEIADKEFLRLRVSLDEYRRKVKSVVASGKFEEVELDIESFNAYIQSGALDALNMRIASINNMEIEEVSFTPFLTVLRDLRFKTLGDVEKMRKECSELAYQIALRQFNDTDIDIIGSTIGLMNLCIVHIIKSGIGEVGVKMLLDFIYGEKSSNARVASRFVEYANNAGVNDGK